MMQATQILVSDIPEFQQYFDFPAFNALQSAMMGPILESSQNLVCTAPTASGKTVVLELALLKFFHERGVGKCKAIYIGPLKSLVAEKFEQWTVQFPHLRIGALTGDTDGDELGFLNSYDCLCATPEKLDSVTRRWKENRGLSDHIGLLLVDEIHCLSDNRGGCLEGLIARFQTMQKIRRLQGSELPISFLRIVAVSATFANVEDLADWLDAECHVFGDEFRPVPIERVVLGFPPAKNDFLFQNLLDFKLLDLIRKYSEGKPTLIFCATRKGAVETAKQLRNCAGPGFFIRDSAHRAHLFNAAMNAADKVLAETIREGIAFHSAGLVHSDRTLVETLFREGFLLAVSSTTTLGMGINLPARLVIIKGTKYYDSLRGWVSLSRTQITQLTGRAGRPQFDTAGTALILTEQRDVQMFSSIVHNLDTVESHLGEHLSEFVATEIVQQTITKADEAVQWIDSTFLALRMQKNPMCYQFRNIARSSDPTDAAHQLVLQCVDDLVKKELICYTSDGGVAARIGAVLLAKFCLRVETVELIVSKLKSVNTLEDVFKLLCQSVEFSDYGIKMGEKGALNALLKSDKLKFRICKKVSCTADKIAILLQCLLDKQNIENWQLKQEASQTLIIARRIGGAMLQFLFDASELDVHLSTLASTVQLQQSLRTVIWPDSTSPLQQLDGVGPVIAMNLSLNSISTFADVESTSAAEIGHAAQKSMTFGSNLKNSLNAIPKLSSTLDATIVGKSPHKISIHALLKQERPDYKCKSGFTQFALICIHCFDQILLKRKFRLLPGENEYQFSVDVAIDSLDAVAGPAVQLLPISFVAFVDSFVGVDAKSEFALDVRSVSSLFKCKAAVDNASVVQPVTTTATVAIAKRKKTSSTDNQLALMRDEATKLQVPKYPALKRQRVDFDSQVVPPCLASTASHRIEMFELPAEETGRSSVNEFEDTPFAMAAAPRFNQNDDHASLMACFDDFF